MFLLRLGDPLPGVSGPGDASPLSSPGLMLSKETQVIITHHALYRFIERILGYDWKPLQKEYRKQFPKRKYVESQFMYWVEDNLCLETFRQFIIKATNNGNTSHICGIWRVVYDENRIITIREAK